MSSLRYVVAIPKSFRTWLSGIYDAYLKEYQLDAKDDEAILFKEAVMKKLKAYLMKYVMYGEPSVLFDDLTMLRELLLELFKDGRIKNKEMVWHYNNRFNLALPRNREFHRRLDAQRIAKTIQKSNLVVEKVTVPASLAYFCITFEE